MKGRLRGANKSVQDLNCKYFHFFCGHAATQDVEPLWWATYDWPLAKLEKLGPWAQRPLLNDPWAVHYDVFVAQGPQSLVQGVIV